MESSPLKVTLEHLRFLLGLWISRLPSSIVRREMRLLWAVLNSVKFWEYVRNDRDVAVSSKIYITKTPTSEWSSIRKLKDKLKKH